MIVSMDKKYTLDGEVFTVLTVTKPGRLPVVGYTPHGTASQFQANGSSIYGGAKLVEVSPYADFQIDEHVMVRDRDSTRWFRRLFSGVDKLTGLVTADFGPAWICQKASVETWQQCRRPTAEELST